MRPAFLDSMSWAMAEVYASVTDRILINLAHYFPYIKDEAEVKGAFEYQTRMLAQIGQVRAETIWILQEKLGDADDALKGVLEAAILDSLKNEEPKLRKAAEMGLLGKAGRPEVTPNMMQAFQMYYKQAADKLNLVNTVMLESTETAYRATVGDVTAQLARTQTILNEETGQVITGVTSYNKAMRDGVRRMVDNGLTGFIDHGGHHWSPEAYVAMDIRTTMFNTGRAAVWERNQEYGNDLYQVSSKNAARPLCYPWQGKVLSSSGRTGMTTDLDGNEVIIHSEDEVESFRYGGGLFGVNCGHYPMVFIPGVSTIKPPPQDEEENAEAYAESQKQRALERKLREEKRDLKVMKAQGASEDEIRAQKQRVSQASKDIDEFCEQTGRTRRRSREAAPTRATWETDQGKVERFRGDYVPATDSNNTPPRDNGGGGDDGNPPININIGPNNNPPVQQVTEVEDQALLRGRMARENFTPASSLSEAEQYAGRYADRVVYNGKMTLETANAVNRELSSLEAAYPATPFRDIRQNGRIKAIAQANYRTLEINAGKIAEPMEAYSARQKQAEMALTRIRGMSPADQARNSKVADLCERVLKCSRFDVVDPTNPIGSTIAHEYGHVLADQYFGQINGAAACINAGSPACREARELVRETYRKAMENGDAYRLSEYSTTNEHEFLAESFASFWIGEKQPDYIFDMVKAVFGHGKL